LVSSQGQLMNNDLGQYHRGPVVVPAEQAKWYRDQGWWSDEPLAVLIHRRAGDDPEGVAYIGENGQLTWAAYDRAADALAARLVGTGVERGSRVAVFLPDGPLIHVAYVACERAGVVIVGVPERAGVREIAHLVSSCNATLMLCLGHHRDQAAGDLVAAVRDLGAPILRHAELDGGGFELYEWTSGAAVRVDSPAAGIEGRQLSPDELWLLNLTSGTTGLPKCVEQVEDRWMYFVRIAEQAANLSSNDVMMSIVPSPYGFSLWTAHFTPAMLGITCVVRDHFDAATALRVVEKHRVTVLACVTTQFVMMLASPVFDDVDLSSLRVLYTGGERVSPEKAREWEARTNSTILQFYGSNEIGPFSCTSLRDDQERRLTTVGRVVPGLEYRIYDANGRDITTGGAAGQPGARGPGVCSGYWNDDAANAQLYNAGGYLLMPDLVTIDDEGYVRIVGRKSDVIIRGGKNISAASVEADVAAHPAVDMVAALAVADPVFGERVGVVVSLRAPATTLDLEGLITFLAERGVSKEYFPEYLVIIEEMPQSIGGKIAKSELKARFAELLSHRTA
jgi:acyl-CoA synthetase